MTPRLSNRSRTILAVGVIWVAAMIIGIALQPAGSLAALAISDIGEGVLVSLSATVVLWVAFSFARDEPWRLTWLLIGAGVACFAIGDLVWTYYEILLKVEPPYPGLPDVFYLLQYPLIAAGLLRAALGYRALVDVKRPAILSSIVAVTGTALLWWGLIKPFLIAPDVSFAEAATSIAYPVLDLWVLVVPALLIALIVSRMGRGMLAWPWFASVLGVLLLAIADSGYAWLQAYDRYVSGSLIDYGWSLGFVALGVAAMIAYDIAHPTR